MVHQIQVQAVSFEFRSVNLTLFFNCRHAITDPNSIGRTHSAKYLGSVSLSIH